MFDGEIYDYKKNEDGSKILSKERNERGFKISIEVSGDKEELARGIQAVKDFYVKSDVLLQKLKK
ncbi:hypothetical protein [Paenibacillus macquariensis]|uniref:hypothetical protein n=1 Tax=Paenibacillus macquariensis TaxID=948756 RepID=UPI0011154B12|nr:hypothetical protein [Paenibacillus macquariensis]MEC0089931.1 hypothetical protein [Paenibacillus macquariensis]